MKDYKKIVKDVLFEVIGIEVGENRQDLDLIENGLVDSLAMINMIVLIEERLGKKIDSKNFTNDDFRTFNNIESLLERV